MNLPERAKELYPHDQWAAQEKRYTKAAEQ